MINTALTAGRTPAETELPLTNADRNLRKGHKTMRGLTLWVGLAGVVGAATAVVAQVPSEPRAIMITEDDPAAEREASRELWLSRVQARAEHWDLWANYCHQKRREHDPVRHYHPLVQMKYSLLPGHCSCGEHVCSACGGKHHGEFHEAGHVHTPPASQPLQPHADRQAIPAQPPVPPVVSGPQNPTASQELTDSPRHPHATSHDGNEGAAIPGQPHAPVELSPERTPVVVPPITPASPPAVPRNPLPKRSVTPPAQPSDAAPPVPPSRNPRTSRRIEPVTPPAADLSRYIQTK